MISLMYFAMEYTYKPLKNLFSRCWSCQDESIELQPENL